jgi:hypothetical protein
MQALNRLQKAFLVCEDQIDSDWERGWSTIDAEWPAIRVAEEKRCQAIEEVISRFFEAHVFATFEQLHDWCALPQRSLQAAVEQVQAAGSITSCTVDGMGEGWISADELPSPADLPPSVFMLHRADYLVRSHGSELKRRFAGEEVLQYLLIDGAFHGAVLGHWRIGPHDVRDIVLTLPARERATRREEILDAVSWWYKPPRSRILRYDGHSIA